MRLVVQVEGNLLNSGYFGANNLCVVTRSPVRIPNLLQSKCSLPGSYGSATKYFATPFTRVRTFGASGATHLLNPKPYT